ncbi:hypothetical protein BSKO_00569 [Bryopsis sp. KO-2023]|nr:hypothetical protein BSKO_00569 [Bryopsis sp. KO-2023]
MTHDVIMAKIRCPTEGIDALLAVCKCHNGDLAAEFCSDLAEADKFARPQIFSPPKHGWWNRTGASHGLKVVDLLEKLSSIPPQYRPVTNNCHHFAKDFWNWHAKEHMSRGGPSMNRQQKRYAREIRWPMGSCKRRKTVYESVREDET